jgi:cell division protein FtsI (penicillin-binding protein 3)
MTRSPAELAASLFFSASSGFRTDPGETRGDARPTGPGGSRDREPAALVRARARDRVRLVGGALFVLMFGTAARGVHLAVDPDPRTLAIATDKRWAAVSVQGPRGEILDADGDVLAKSVRTPAVFVDPTIMAERVPDIDATAVDLARILNVDIATVRAALASKGRYVRLARGVHPGVADELRALGLTSKGLIIEENYERYYPQGRFAGQVVGFVDSAGRGVQGVESFFEDRLAGSELVTQHRVNSVGRVLELGDRDDRAMQGMSVHTSIDPDVQRDAERALQGVIDRHAPMWASAVVIEVKTGRVIAMATGPGFDPNDANDVTFDVMRNRGVSDPVEPGSVFKCFTYASALQEGLTTPTEIIETPSPYPIAGAMIRDDHPHGHVTAAEIIKFSSNVGAAKLALRLGSKRLLSYYEGFGFGETSGVQTTAEEAGKRSPPHVGPVELATISYGQGITATLLQLAMATAALANDGLRMRPILVDEVVDGWGEVRQAWEPTPVRQVVEPETARLVAAAMEHVTDLDGTAPRARIPGYRVSGKTGTAYKVKNGQYSATARYAVFIGFAPTENPELAMAILVDEPTMGSRYGGVVAAPVFAEVIGPELRRRNIPVDATAPLPFESTGPGLVSVPVEPQPLVLSWQGEAWRVPDLVGRDLRGVLAALEGAGLDLHIEGSGLLVSQEPAAGAMVAPGASMTLLFE